MVGRLLAGAWFVACGNRRMDGAIIGDPHGAQAIVMDKAGPYPGFQPSSEIEPD